MYFKRKAKKAYDYLIDYFYKNDLYQDVEIKVIWTSIDDVEYDRIFDKEKETPAKSHLNTPRKENDEGYNSVLFMIFFLLN